MTASTLISLLLVSLALQQINCQDDLRASNDKSNVEGGGQSRTIYSQRHLSPHRMMHFGKRPEIIPPPRISTTSGVYDLYQPRQQQVRLQADKYPYLFSIELERGQTLRAVPEDLPALEVLQQPRNSILYSLEQPIDVDSVLTEQQQKLTQQQVGKPFDATRFMKLMKNDESNTTNESGSEEVIEPDGSSSQEGQQPLINLSSRSVPMTRGNTLNLPKAYISNLLYGRQGPPTSLANYGSYNKKAEPKNNLFMHFGRK